MNKPGGIGVPSTVDDLRTRLNLGVVAIVGAGLSLGARYPDSVNLTALVWDAIDADREARAALATQLEVPDTSGRALVGDNWDRIRIAWERIAASLAARHRFQHAFAEVDHSRAAQPSASHEALACLIHAGIVECVVSYNWDSARERAYERLYGTRLPDGILYKPHGNVADPDAAWVLPHEDGVVGAAVALRVKELADQHPRTLLVVGYSERDQTVVNELIGPLDERWRVCRVGPTVDGPDDVPGAADSILASLAEPIAQREDSSAWTVVKFNSQRGIESALEGRRLLPTDVEVCPRLPEVEVVTGALLRTHAVVLNGASGSGKSITAYQVAQTLVEQGFEILRLRDVSRAAGIRAWLSDLSLFPRKKLLFVDDAQDLSTDTVRELAETASPDRLVLIAGVDHVAGGVATYSVSDTTAVGVLTQYMLAHREQMLAKVHELDDRVGDGITDERFEDRVRHAARELTAWMFFYTLTGGWRRTAQTLEEVRGPDRADLLGCALAIAQIASVDTGVTVDDLVPYASALGRDEAWINQNLEVLRTKRLAITDGGVWRCPHLRTAYAIINWMLHPPRWNSAPPQPRARVSPIASAQRDTRPTAPPASPKRQAPQRVVLPEDVIERDREQVAAMFKVALDSATTSMRGIAWLLGRNHSTEAGWVLRRHNIRSAERDRALALRALATPPGPDVAMASQLLEQLAGPDAPEITKALWEQVDAVVTWVKTVTPEVGWALGALLNVLINDDRERIAAALSGIDATAVASLVVDGGWSHIYSTTKAVDRIAHAGGVDFIRAVGGAFDEDALDRMLDDIPGLAFADELLSLLAHLNPDLGLRLFEKHSARFAAMFSRKPLESFRDLFTTFLFLLEYFGMLNDRRPRPAARRATKTFLRALDHRALISELSHPTFDWRWHNFVQFLFAYADTDPRGWAKVAKTVDLDSLEAVLIEQASAPCDELLYLLHFLAEARSEDVRVLLDAHEGELGALHAMLVHLYPELAVRLLLRGLPLDLGLSHQRYSTAAEELDLIGELDAGVAREVAEANSLAFLAGISARQSPPFVKLRLWIDSCDRWAPGLIDEVVAGLNEGTVAGWADALRDPRARLQIAPLVLRAAKTSDGPASREANELKRRFPSLDR